MNDKYILDGHKPVPATELIEWAKWMETANRIVTKTEIGDVRVSTVFLGLDHSFGVKGSPVLFETMVFGGPLDQEMERYSTWDEATAGHETIVERVRAEPKPEPDHA